MMYISFIDNEPSPYTYLRIISLCLWFEIIKGQSSSFIFRKVFINLFISITASVKLFIYAILLQIETIKPR